MWSVISRTFSMKTRVSVCSLSEGVIFFRTSVRTWWTFMSVAFVMINNSFPGFYRLKMAASLEFLQDKTYIPTFPILIVIFDVWFLEEERSRERIRTEAGGLLETAGFRPPDSEQGGRERPGGGQD